MKKRIISIFLALVMFVGCLPTMVGLSSAYTVGTDGMGPRIIEGGKRDFVWPVPGWYNIKSCFYDQRNHCAIDIAANQGTSIVASYDGTVVKAVDGGTSYYGDGFGNYVVVKHNYTTSNGTVITLYSRYSHMYSVSVSEGANVTKGQTVLGKVGATGAAEGAHLDFQICYGGWAPYQTYSIDPYANDLLELPSDLTVTDSWSCGQSYYELITAQYATPLLVAASYPAYCSVKVTASTTYIKSLPCSESTDASSETIETATKGTQYQAIGLVKNTAGNLWYKVQTKSGTTGYLYAGECAYVSQSTKDISGPGITAPSNHTHGTIFILTGTVNSTYNQLTSVSAYIYSGSSAQGTAETGGSASVSGNSITLGGSSIDSKTEFNKLSVGTHTYVVRASYKNYYAKSATTLGTNTGETEVYRATFNVVSAATTCSHSYTSAVTKAATCVSNGVRTYTCSKCGASYTETIAATGVHTYGSWSVTKAATCTASGTKTRSCTVCGTEETQTISATGHSYGSWVTVTAAGCTKAGTQKKTCSSCGDVQTQSIAATGHNYTSVTVPASCTENEKVRYTCKNCGDTYDVYAEGNYSEWSETKPVGVDESRIETKTQYRYADYETKTSYSTSLSGYTLISSTWEKSGSGTVKYVKSWPSGFYTGHSLYSTYNKSAVSASETTTNKTVINSNSVTGYLYYHWCRGTYTGGPINRATSPTKSGEFTSFHAFYSTTSPSSLTASSDGDGSYTYPNSSCCTDSHWYYYVPVYTQSYTTYKKLFTYGRWGSWSSWGDTAYSSGSTRKVETRTMYRYLITATGEHTWDNGSITTAATCTTAGVKTFTCTACGETKTEPIPATGHKFENGACTLCGLKSPTIAVGKVTAAPGETVTIPVIISNSSGFAGFTLSFSMDSALSIQKITQGDLLQAANGTFTENAAGNVVTWFSAANTTGNGTLLYMTVSVADSAQEGDYDIQVALKDENATNFVDENGQAIPVTLTSGTVSVQNAPVDAKLKVFGGSVSATPGATITVPVMISGGENFAGFTFTISADDALTLKNIEKGAMLKDADGMFTKNVAQGTVNWTSSEDLAGDGELLLLTFAVSETASEGTQNISIRLKDNKATNMVNADEQAVSTAFEDIKVTVRTVVYGDTNGDGEVDTSDAVRLVRYLVELVDLTDTQKMAADVNHDNDLTSADSIRLVRYLVGLVDSLETSTETQTHAVKSAQTRGATTVSVGTVSGDPGDTVTLPVTISGNTGFAGFTMEVSYPDGLTLTKVAKGSLLKESDGGALTSNVNKNLINWNDSENLSGDGQILILTFTIDSDADAGDYAVAIRPRDGKAGNFVDENGTPVSATYQNGTIAVKGHEHSYTSVVTAPTCTEQGYTTYTCSCGDSYKGDYTAALGHNYSYKVTTAPTASATGKLTGTCSRCTGTTTVTLPKLNTTDYSYSVVKAATCTATGTGRYTWKTTTYGTLYFDVAIAKASHSYASEVTAPTCTEQGYTTYTCSACGDTYKDTYTTALGHDTITDPAVPATCTETGLTEGSHCSRCDYKVTQKTVSALGHDEVKHAGQAATCTEKGWEAYVTCSRCDYTTYKEIAALGHDMITDPAVPATCTESGLTEGSHCSRCEYKVAQKTVAALGHDEVSHAGQKATCTEKGWEAYVTCNRCDYTTYKEIPTLGHDEVKHSGQSATCTEVGWNAYVSCSRCDYTTYKEIPALGHDIVHHEAQAATCTEIGWDAYDTCSRCDYTTYKEITALGHDMITDPAVPATCTETGLTEGSHCSRCEYKIDQESIETLGHDLIHHDAQAATCIEIGWEAYDTCSRCDHTTYKEIPVLGHDIVHHEAQAATCTEIGWVAYDTCSRCDHTTYQETPALGHSWGDWMATEDPAIEVRTCSRCGATETQNVFLECYFDDFTDCCDEWYHEAVDFVVSQGLMNGMGHQKFEPRETMTRAMMVTVLYRMAGSPAVDGPSTFADVPTGEWYSDAIAWAQQNNIVNGVGHNRFDPDESVKREDLATILWRAQGCPEVDIDLSGFRDSDTIDSYAYGAMQWAVSVGIFIGDGGKLRPVDSATRAELACIIMRYLNGSYHCSER